MVPPLYNGTIIPSATASESRAYVSEFVRAVQLLICIHKGLMTVCTVFKVSYQPFICFSSRTIPIRFSLSLLPARCGGDVPMAWLFADEEQNYSSTNRQRRPNRRQTFLAFPTQCHGPCGSATPSAQLRNRGDSARDIPPKRINSRAPNNVGNKALRPGMPNSNNKRKTGLRLPPIAHDQGPGGREMIDLQTARPDIETAASSSSLRTSRTLWSHCSMCSWWMANL